MFSHAAKSFKQLQLQACQETLRRCWSYSIIVGTSCRRALDCTNLQRFDSHQSKSASHREVQSIRIFYYDYKSASEHSGLGELKLV